MIDNWRQRAECRGLDPDVFHSPNTAPALETCAGCPVRAECLADTIAEEQHLALFDVLGVRGGMTAAARQRQLRAERGRRLAPTPIQHGTIEGFRRCWRRPEGACSWCTDAHRRWSNPGNAPHSDGRRDGWTTIAARLNTSREVA